MYEDVVTYTELMSEIDVDYERKTMKRDIANIMLGRNC